MQRNHFIVEPMHFW